MNNKARRFHQASVLTCAAVPRREGERDRQGQWQEGQGPHQAGGPPRQELRVLRRGYLMNEFWMPLKRSTVRCRGGCIVFCLRFEKLLATLRPSQGDSSLEAGEHEHRFSEK